MGLAVNGFYAIASKFSLMITFLTSAFTMAWQDYSFSVNNDNGNRELFTKGIDLFYKFLILGGSMFILVIPYFFNYVIDSKYSESYNLIALCIGVTLFSSVGDFLSQTFLALKKTNLIIYTSFFITIFCVIFSPIFVNLFGVNGVNFTLIIAYFFNFLWRLLYLKKSFKYNFNFILYFALMIYFFLVCYIYKVNVPLINLSSLIITLLLFYYFFRQEIINILKSTIRR
jgi:O-antigen/teichoic acid export membrane protein